MRDTTSELSKQKANTYNVGGGFGGKKTRPTTAKNNTQPQVT
jgi:hypothetical protein